MGMQTLKPSFYDSFHCIAAKCTYTCCRDWNIVVDEHTYAEKQDVYKPYTINPTKDTRKVIVLRENGTCPFLDEKGLCSLVIRFGEDILCHTCTSFPRFQLDRVDMIEQSLSNACPAVLHILHQLKPPLSFLIENTDALPVDAPVNEEVIKCRDLCIDILQIVEMPLWARLFVLYRFSCQIDCKSLNNIASCLEQYGSGSYLLEIWQFLGQLECDMEEKLNLSILLFNSINKGFTKYFGYCKYIEPLLCYIRECEIKKLVLAWEDFEKVWLEQSDFFENFSVNYVFRNLVVSQEKQDFRGKTTALMLEMSMIKFTLFLWWLRCGGRINDLEIFEICCYYARIIEHNFDKMYEFMKDMEAHGWLAQGVLFMLIL